MSVRPRREPPSPTQIVRPGDSGVSGRWCRRSALTRSCASGLPQAATGGAFTLWW